MPDNAVVITFPPHVEIAIALVVVAIVVALLLAVVMTAERNPRGHDRHP